MQVLKSKNSVINKAFFVEMVTFTKIIGHANYQT